MLLPQDLDFGYFSKSAESILATVEAVVCHSFAWRELIARIVVGTALSMHVVGTSVTTALAVTFANADTTIVITGQFLPLIHSTS